MSGFEFGNRKYNLIGNLIHCGSATDGFFKCQVEHAGTWYEIHDLLVQEILPEQVAISETYLLLYRA